MVRNPLELWHLSSLDAPTVAAVWAWALARSARLHLSLAAPLMLALATWVLYVADRLLDGTRVSDPMLLRDRHHFHRRHRRIFILIAILATASLACLVTLRMPTPTLRDNLALGLWMALYLLSVHGPAAWPTRFAFPKELFVGMTFAAGTAVPAWSRLPIGARERAVLLPIALLFAALCWMNCSAIESWEPRPPSAPLHRSTRWLGRHLRAFAALLALGTALLAFVLELRRIPLATPQDLTVLAAIVLSALSLALLDALRHRLAPLPLRAAADAVLLTPLLFLPVLR